MTTRRAFVMCAIALGLGGCLEMQRLPPTAEVPPLTGMWQGAWGGTVTTPMRLVIAEQRDDRISGVVTFGFPEGQISTAFRGRLGVRNGALALRASSATTARSQEFLFSTVRDERLAGRGVSTGLGAHEGPVELTRAPR